MIGKKNVKPEKYSKLFVREVEEQNRIKEEQAELRKKYYIHNTDQIIVEKSNTFKFILRLLIQAGQVVFWIVNVCLISLAIITLLYPVPRRALFDALWIIYLEIQMLIFR